MGHMKVVLYRHDSQKICKLVNVFRIQVNQLFLLSVDNKLQSNVNVTITDGAN